MKTIKDMTMGERFNNYDSLVYQNVISFNRLFSNNKIDTTIHNKKSSVTLGEIANIPGDVIRIITINGVEFVHKFTKFSVPFEFKKKELGPKKPKHERPIYLACKDSVFYKAYTYKTRMQKDLQISRHVMRQCLVGKTKKDTDISIYVLSEGNVPDEILKQYLESIEQ